MNHNKETPVRSSYLPYVLILSCFISRVVWARELQVADVFADNAVLQQGSDVTVWGTTSSRQKVTVRFAGQVKTTHADEDGSWQVILSPMPADCHGKTMVVESGDDLLEIHALLVGEVWYASGQSNMQMTLGACAGKNRAFRGIVDAVETNNIRWLRIDEPDAPQPLARRQKVSAWQQDLPANRAKQSAVAYFFARCLHQQLDVPVGIIESSWGGKPIEGFVPRSQFERRETLRPILELAEQDRMDDLAALKGGVIIRNTAGMPGRIFNARVSPITPYPVRGIIWYQGESNAGRGEDPRNYRIKMRALIDGWRQAWAQPQLPFYFVQLPAFKEESTGWVRLREEQRLSLSIPHTGMAVTIDLRDSDIHPANKLDVGQRLANWALAKTYEKDVPPSGPLFQSATVQGARMRLQFQHAESGLMVARKEGLAPPKPMPELALAEFEIADEAGNWHPAKATIDGPTVLVHSSGVLKPRAIRYACSGAPANANLYNQLGLPASPFCSELRLLPWQSEQ